MIVEVVALGTELQLGGTANPTRYTSAGPAGRVGFRRLAPRLWKETG